MIFNSVELRSSAKCVVCSELDTGLRFSSTPHECLCMFLLSVESIKFWQLKSREHTSKARQWDECGVSWFNQECLWTLMNTYEEHLWKSLHVVMIFIAGIQVENGTYQYWLSSGICISNYRLVEVLYYKVTLNFFFEGRGRKAWLKKSWFYLSFQVYKMVLEVHIVLFLFLSSH